ncbi:superoxide dismutase [Cu-Zn] SodC [Pistricoccus aurantiacus]|uniref:superoxide dismutase [Cu-Zn] SodC n=1 Tax=Pistricoccus aurantiacus TaxID=1883414 RepID=UPI00362F4DC6
MRLGHRLMVAMGTCLLAATGAQAAVEVTMHKVSPEGVGELMGTVHLEDSEYGLLLLPGLSGLTPGAHGFHVHERPLCEPAEKDGETIAAGAAAGHFDPDATGRHAGPYGDGHLGDLPVLLVNQDGIADTQILAPRLTVDDLAGHALVIHAGGDNYADEPEPLGGGGERVACGVADFPAEPELKPDLI